MRKCTVILMLLALVLSLAACGGQESEAGAAVAESPVSTETPAVITGGEGAAIQPPAESADADGISWHFADGTLTVSGTGPMPDYELLAAPWDESGDAIGVKKLVVEEGISYLGAHSFAACLNLAEVSLPDSLRGIGSFCFADCLALESIAFNKGLLYIGESAFSGSGLGSVSLPDGFAALGELSFTLCGGLKTVSLPDSLCSVGEDAFAGCEALESIQLHSGADAEALLIEQGLEGLLKPSGEAIAAAGYPWSGSVEGCSWALQHGVLTVEGESVPSFGTTDGAQAPWAPMATLIQEIRLADGCTAIGDYAFWNCGSLQSVKLPDSVRAIGDYAFGACEGLEHFDFPAALESIGEGTFSFCSALQDAQLPEGLVRIGVDAFQMCSAMERMSIPASVTEIGDEALSFGGEEPAEITAPAGSYAQQWVKDNQ